MATASDSFTRADAADLGAAWVGSSNSPQVISNELAPSQVTPTGSRAVYATAFDSSNHYAQMRIRANLAGPGLICRAASASATALHYLGFSTGSGVAFYRFDGTNYVTIGSATTVTIAGEDMLRFAVVGPTLSFYVNTRLVMEALDTTLTSGLYAGLFIENLSTRNDDWSAADVEATNKSAMGAMLNRGRR